LGRHLGPVVLRGIGGAAPTIEDGDEGGRILGVGGGVGGGRARPRPLPAAKGGGFSVSVVMAWMCGTVRAAFCMLSGSHATTAAMASAATASPRAGQARANAASPTPTRASKATPIPAKAATRSTLNDVTTPHQPQR